MATTKTPPSGKTAPESGEHWHERHQRGELGGYGSYGGAQDQPPEESKPASVPDQQPRVPSSARSARGAADDAEPYRAERVDGHAADDAGQEVAATRGEGKMSEQFAGRDAQTQASGQALEHGQAFNADKTDQALVAHLKTRLAQAGLHAQRVRVTSEQGRILLRGQVDDAGTKAAITQVIRSAVGQASVDNGIEVRDMRGQDTQDKGLAADADEYTVLNGRQV